MILYEMEEGILEGFAYRCDIQTRSFDTHQLTVTAKKQTPSPAPATSQLPKKPTMTVVDDPNGRRRRIPRTRHRCCCGCLLLAIVLASLYRSCESFSTRNGLVRSRTRRIRPLPPPPRPVVGALLSSDADDGDGDVSLRLNGEDPLIDGEGSVLHPPPSSSSSRSGTAGRENLSASEDAASSHLPPITLPSSSSSTTDPSKSLVHQEFYRQTKAVTATSASSSNFLVEEDASSSPSEASSQEESSSSASFNSQKQPKPKSRKRPTSSIPTEPRHMELMWCSNDNCRDAVRERIVGDHNQILLNGPATGQVAYQWSTESSSTTARRSNKNHNGGGGPVPLQLPIIRDETTASGGAPRGGLQHRDTTEAAPSTHEPSVFVLVKHVDPRHQLLKLAARAVQELCDQHNIHVLLEPTTAARLKHYHGVDGPRIHLFEVTPTSGFGSDLKHHHQRVNEKDDPVLLGDMESLPKSPSATTTTAHSPYAPDLICTMGGDGLLMHVGMMFQGPVPPILCVSGGSMGFLTPFWPEEMVDAIRTALGVMDSSTDDDDEEDEDGNDDENRATNNKAPPKNAVRSDDIDVYPPNMPSYPYEPLAPTSTSAQKATFGLGNRICLSIRMRLECRVLNAEGLIRSRYNVLNEVVIDRGSSPYLAALECFVDDVHLTTVQADGVIFATPTGSTAYSLAAGSSVVHPAVPCILVTPICPHVLSFRSMVFPDHVVLRCYVPSDARSEASVAFDGKHRQGLARGDSVQVQMSPYPVPTINKVDHSADWLHALKRSFNFNTRARQEPL